MNEKDMQFGAKAKTSVVDEHGSTVTINESVKNGRTVAPIRYNYNFRVRVNSRTDELMAYEEFSSQISEDRGMIDPQWKVERSRLGEENGFYYVVKSYTRLAEA